MPFNLACVTESQVEQRYSSQSMICYTQSATRLSIGLKGLFLVSAFCELHLFVELYIGVEQYTSICLYPELSTF